MKVIKASLIAVVVITTGLYFYMDMILRSYFIT
jgi:hypothetical protein